MSSSKRKEITEFQNLVYNATKKIPRGMISTYAKIAKYIGRERAFRAVGNALNKNPFAPLVPCHRVVASNGTLGGFAFGTDNKIALLKKEGITVRDGKISDFKDKVFEFKI